MQTFKYSTFCIFNVEKDFKQYVINYFISEYEAGRTPNPCVICNRYLKFEGLLAKADELGIEYISTGHYASAEKKDGKYLLKRA
jgi:tRNA-specific 2-thiouridylase